MVPLGSAIGLAGLSGHGSKVIGCAVAISAGTFLQLATNDLLPETHMAGPNRFKALGGFVLGLALTAVTKYME
jgi:zinc transporter ZupT